MRARLDWDGAASALTSAGSVVVCAHVDPDGDAIGSVLAACNALRRIGVAAVPTLADDAPVPQTYAFLPGSDLFVRAADITPPDVFLALDTPSPSRLGVAQELADGARLVVVADHHPDNRHFGDVELFDPRAAATGQIVWRLLKHLGVVPTPVIAQCLYVALMTDTGRFSYGNTDRRALRDAANMVIAGADPYAAYDATYEHRSAGSLRLLGLALSRVTVVNGGRVAYSWVSEDDLAATGTTMPETENLVDAVRQLGGVDAVFLAKAVGGHVRISLRSKTGADVGAVARVLGGGGHRAAAGATIDGDLDDALAALLPLLPGGDVR
jgi:bifunctional oligoribonuclease and PAP phosphatase NrnA